MGPICLLHFFLVHDAKIHSSKGLFVIAIVLKYSGHAMWFGLVSGQHLCQLSRLAWKHMNVNATYLLFIGPGLIHSVENPFYFLSSYNSFNQKPHVRSSIIVHQFHIMNFFPLFSPTYLRKHEFKIITKLQMSKEWMANHERIGFIHPKIFCIIVFMLFKGE